MRLHPGKSLRFGSVDQIEHFFRGTRDHRTIAPHDDGTLHESGMFDQQVHHVVPVGVGIRIESERLEILVLADEICRRIRNHVEEALEILPCQRVVQVLNDFEVRSAFFQGCDRAPRLSSARVVIDPNLRHALLLAGPL